MHVCKKCESIERTKDNRCANCRREYARQRYSKNSIKIILQKKLRYIENKDIINLGRRNKYKENPEDIKAKSREWARNNRDKNVLPKQDVLENMGKVKVLKKKILLILKYYKKINVYIAIKL